MTMLNNLPGNLMEPVYDAVASKSIIYISRMKLVRKDLRKSYMWSNK